MSFDPSTALRKATSRAKSDVANKLVSMLLHELSRRLSQQTGFAVNSAEYAGLASGFFGNLCPYCGCVLVKGKVAVEHLDGMNRFRAGLHVPGNVVVSCSDCNREKRRDDQLLELILAESGWKSFLAHDSTVCHDGCKTCAYWKKRFPNRSIRSQHLWTAPKRLGEFRTIPEIERVLEACIDLRRTIQPKLTSLYRDGQVYAKTQIDDLVKLVAKQ